MTTIPAPTEGPRNAKLSGKISVGDTGSVRMEPGLLTFLATPFPDENGERPGVHVHPMSGVPLGLGIHAAIVAVAGRENGVDVLRACECSYEAPIPFDEPVYAHAEVTKLSKHSVRCSIEVRIESNDTLLMKGHVILVHSKGGAAQDITHLQG